MGDIKFTILLCLGVAAIISVNVEGAEYGQHCNVTDPCFSSQSNDPLECDDGTKLCRCYKDMFRHPDLDRCVSPEGKACTFQVENGTLHKTCTEFAQCRPNDQSNTTKEGTCYCDLDAKYDHHTLECKLTHGSSRCQKERQCDYLSFLTCRSGKCVCQDEENQEYMDTGTEQKCFALADGECSVPQLPQFPQCGMYMHCDNSTNTCQCDKDFDKTPERTCGRGYGATCSKDNECHPHFVCNNATETSTAPTQGTTSTTPAATSSATDDPTAPTETEGTAASSPTPRPTTPTPTPAPGGKICRCREGQEHHVSNSTSTCRILVGQTCNTSATEDFECTLHASCVQEKCACSAGYKNNPETGKCLAEFGSVCSNDEGEGVGCIEEDFLECRNDICQCKADYESDSGQRKCRGYIGQQCQNNNDGCIANSICSSGTCRCQSGQVAQDDMQRCLATLGGNCGVDTPCSAKHYVMCNNSRCSCSKPDLQLEDQDNAKCVARAGAPCGDAADRILCVVDSECSNANVCVCNAGLASHRNGTCVPKSGSSHIVSSGSMLAFMMGVLVMGKF